MAESRGPRDLTSQVGTTGAMRARDVSRPDEDELATAALEVVVSYRPTRTPRPQPWSDQEPADVGGSVPDSS